MSAPTPPDPMKTAQTAFDFAKKGGIFQSGLNQVNQITPTGSLTYKRIGTNPDGSPRYQATTALSPGQRALMQQQTNTGITGSTIAQNIEQQNAARLAAGPDMDETGITKALMGWGRDYLQPGFDQQQAAEDARLQHQGIMPGSEAWTRAHTESARNMNDAYTKLLLTGQGQAMQAAEAKYMDPLRAISTLQGGQQPGVNFAQTPQSGVSDPTGFAQLAEQNYQQKAQNYGNLMSGLFSIPSTILGGWATGGL